MHTETLDTVQEIVRAWNAHDADAVASLYEPSYEGLDMTLARREHGRDGARHAFQRFLTAFPDLELVPDDLVIADDRATMVWYIRGTHCGVLLRIPPTHKSVTFAGVSILTVHDERVVRSVTLWDLAGILRAIGLLPALPEA